MAQVKTARIPLTEKGNPNVTFLKGSGTVVDMVEITIGFSKIRLTKAEFDYIVQEVANASNT